MGCPHPNTPLRLPVSAASTLEYAISKLFLPTDNLAYDSASPRCCALTPARCTSATPMGGRAAVPTFATSRSSPDRPNRSRVVAVATCSTRSTRRTPPNRSHQTSRPLLPPSDPPPTLPHPWPRLAPRRRRQVPRPRPPRSTTTRSRVRSRWPGVSPHLSRSPSSAAPARSGSSGVAAAEPATACRHRGVPTETRATDHTCSAPGTLSRTAHDEFVDTVARRCVTVETMRWSVVHCRGVTVHSP